MMKSHNSSTTLLCFSPAVMLVTFLIEIVFAGYIAWRYIMTSTTRLVISILVCLATFQGAEYMLCGGLGVEGGMWSQLGYSAITLLPPLGLHLAFSISSKKSFIVPVAYGTAAIFVAYYSLATAAISGHTCYANYAVFDTHAGFIPSFFYGLYYYGWLVVGVFTAWYLAGKTQKQAVRRALYALAIGYLAFMAPTTAFNLIDPSTVAGIPSIMCGFAVVLAFVLVGKVAPEAIRQKDPSRRLEFRLPF